MERILVTGGAGFIGNAIVNELYKEKKYDIVVLDCLNEQIHGQDYETSSLYRGIKDKCKFIRGDVTNPYDCEAALMNIDYIIHLAAETGTGQSMYEINRYTNVNIMGLSNLMQVVVEKKIPIKKIILSSSRSVYGEGQYLCEKHGSVYPKCREIDKMLEKDFETRCPICGSKVNLCKTNEESKIQPLSVYAVTKYSQEMMLKVVCEAVDIPYTIFRYQNVYGPGQSLKNPYTGILSIFSTLLLKNKELNIFEDGYETRDFIFVSDVARGTIAAINSDQSNREVINLGSGSNTTVLEIAESLKQLYQSSSKIQITGDFRKGDIRHNVANIDKAKKILNFSPEVDLETGLKLFSDWVKKVDKSSFQEAEKNFRQSIEEMECLDLLLKGR